MPDESAWEAEAAEKNLPPEIFSEELTEPEKEVVAEELEALPLRDDFKERGRKIDRDWLARRAKR